MHKIDIHNYEAYLLDYSEGNLTGELQVELELFLIQHPELEINLDELSLVTLENEAASFSNKNSLKKSEADLISETQFIAYIENQLPENERLAVEKSCAINPSLAKELALYNNTIAKADETIVFENKQSLKRKPKVIWFNFSATQYAAAACIVFLIGLFMLWSKTSIDSETSTLADKTDAVTSQTVSSKNNTIEPTHNTNDLTSPKESNTSFAPQALAPIVTIKEKALLATNNPSQKNNTSSIKDTLHPTIKNATIIETPKNEALIALNTSPVAKPKTVVQVITENDDEVVAANPDKKKKGIWAAASRALKNLNHAGVKTVNGDEETSNDNAAYALTLGGVSITHKSGL
ncbi:MAG: hypothetical protein IPL10_19595 [Bacteroidetes bacterium]|nr:hypothetical protein [Bacteroidota bacterium]